MAGNNCTARLLDFDELEIVPGKIGVHAIVQLWFWIIPPHSPPHPSILLKQISNDLKTDRYKNFLDITSSRFYDPLEDLSRDLLSC
jgi:hypothetical protein